MVGQYKLYYFDSRGRGETARLLFHAAGQEFEDVRFSHEQWPEYKPQSPTGKAPWLEALVDSTADFFRDATNETRPYLRALAGNAEGDKDALYKEKFLPALEKTFPYIEQALKKSGSGFIAPSGLTWVDLFIAEAFASLFNLVPDFLPALEKTFPYIEQVLKKSGSGFIAPSGLTWVDLFIAEAFASLFNLVPDVATKYPFAAEYQKRVQGHPKIKDYVATRKQTLN
uniref:Glutathione S-transferase n=1 Tax=Panagrolaimus sp. JU765 TaxID=591449 RepID=A0AC34QIV0_9BILA